MLPTGGKVWQKRYKLGGVERVHSIGAFPLVSLREARAANFELTQMLRAGIDPMAEKQAARQMERLARENGRSLPCLPNRILPPHCPACRLPCGADCLKMVLNSGAIL